MTMCCPAAVILYACWGDQWQIVLFFSFLSWLCSFKLVQEKKIQRSSSRHNLWVVNLWTSIWLHKHSCNYFSLIHNIKDMFIMPLSVELLAINSSPSSILICWWYPFWFVRVTFNLTIREVQHVLAVERDLLQFSALSYTSQRRARVGFS